MRSRPPRPRQCRPGRLLPLLAAVLLLGLGAGDAVAQNGPVRAAPHTLTSRLLGVFPAYRGHRAALAARMPRPAASGVAAMQGGRADADAGLADDDLDTLRLLQLQSIGCFVVGAATSLVALATLTAATAVQGGAPLPLVGELVAGWVTFFTGGCAVGALLVPGITLFEGYEGMLMDLPDPLPEPLR